MLIETIIYLHPIDEDEMGLGPENRSWERTNAIFDIDQVAWAYQAVEDFNPGIESPTAINLKSGETFIIQMSYNDFVQKWKNTKEQ